MADIVPTVVTVCLTSSSEWLDFIVSLGLSCLVIFVEGSVVVENMLMVVDVVVVVGCALAGYRPDGQGDVLYEMILINTEAELDILAGCRFALKTTVTFRSVLIGTVAESQLSLEDMIHSTDSAWSFLSYWMLTLKSMGFFPV